MDVINLHGFQLDLRNRIIKVGSEEVLLHPYEGNMVLVAIQENTLLTVRNKTIIVARLQGIMEEGTSVMMELRNHDEEVGNIVLIGKGLVTLANDIPESVINMNLITIKKGTKNGPCVPVTSIVRQTTATYKSNSRFN